MNIIVAYLSRLRPVTGKKARLIGKSQPKRKLLHLLLVIFLICTGQAAAQNFSGSGVGSVVDAFTGEFIHISWHTLSIGSTNSPRKKNK